MLQLQQIVPTLEFSACLQAATNMTIPLPAAEAAAPPHSVPFLLKLPTAAATLPHAALEVTQAGGGSLATVHWQRSLSGAAIQVGMPLDIDLDAQGAVSWPQQEYVRPPDAEAGGTPAGVCFTAPMSEISVASCKGQQSSCKVKAGIQWDRHTFLRRWLSPWCRSPDGCSRAAA